MISNKELIKILKRFPRSAITNIEEVSASQNEKNHWTIYLRFNENKLDNTEKYVDETK